MRKIILASQSPRRKTLLSTKLGINFIVEKSNYNENNNLNLNPKELAKKHALGKATDIAKNYDSGIVIGGDVFVVFKNEILGKPKDEKHAFDMLKKINDNWVEVVSGIAVIDIDNKKNMLKMK